MATKSGRTIIAEQPFSWKTFFLKWEWLLVILFLGINVMNASLSEYYLSGAGLFNATNSFLEKAFVALPN